MQKNSKLLETVVRMLVEKDTDDEGTVDIPFTPGVPDDVDEAALSQSNVYEKLKAGARFVRVFTKQGKQGQVVYDIRPAPDGKLTISQMEMRPVWTHPISSEGLIEFEKTWRLDGPKDIESYSNVFIGHA